MSVVLLAQALVACGFLGDEPAPPPKAEVQVEAPAPVETKKEGPDLMREQLAAGSAAEALATGEAWLGAHPDDAAAWDLVELAAMRADAAAGLVDRLSADQAIGGQAARHHALRGAMALLAKRPADALVAARALSAVAPGDAAALVAGAVAQGAPAPEGLDAATTALLAQAASNGPVDPAVTALTGWRVGLVRAQLAAVRGDTEAVNAELAALPPGLPKQLGLPLGLGALADHGAAWTLAESVARDALANGDAGGAASALDLGLPRAIAGWKADAALAAATELRKKAEEGKNVEGAAQIAAVEAHAALRAGLPVQAKAAAQLAAAASGAKARGSWELGLASAALGDAAGTAAAAAGCAELEAGVLRDLAAALRGAPKLPGAGLDANRAALVALLAAGWLDDASDALRVAAAATSPDLQLWAATWSSRTGLSGSGATPFGAEATVRASLNKTGGTTLTGDHPETGAWNALITGQPAPAGNGVAALGRARAALRDGDGATAAREYGTLAMAAPAWRTGPWTPVLVMDGPPPEALSLDTELIRAAADPLTPATALHGWTHARTTAEQLWHAGASPIPAGAKPEAAAAVWDAAARYRVLALQWLATGSAFPTAARDALAAAELAAGLTPKAPPTVAELRSSTYNGAVLSFRVLPGFVELLYLTEAGGKIVRLKPATADAIVAWSRAVGAGDAGVSAGDRIREAVLDNASDVLTGLGKYYVVGPAPLGAIAINALPEQRDGLRFMAEIRSVSVYCTFDEIVAPPPDVAEEYVHTVVALASTPSEAEALRRFFPSADVMEGPTATVAGFKATAPGGRFVHIGDFPTGPSGGWMLADGELTLGDVVSMKLGALNGYAGGTGDAETALARLAALRRAGVAELVVGAAGADPAFHERMVVHYWEGVNRRYGASRAFYDGRSATMKEFTEANRPTHWVRYLVAGKP